MWMCMCMCMFQHCLCLSVRPLSGYDTLGQHVATFVLSCVLLCCAAAHCGTTQSSLGACLLNGSPRAATTKVHNALSLVLACSLVVASLAAVFDSL